MILCFYLSLVTASMSFTITETKIFAPLRLWMKSRSRFFGDLLSCGYCLGHWIALILVILFKPTLFQTWWLLDYFFVILIIAWVAGFQWALMCLVMKTAGK
jgi:hypothetical protein